MVSMPGPLFRPVNSKPVIAAVHGSGFSILMEPRQLMLHQHLHQLAWIAKRLRQTDMAPCAGVSPATVLDRDRIVVAAGRRFRLIETSRSPGTAKPQARLHVRGVGES